MNNKNTYISLFSSAGIGCYGFKKENFQCLATNEFLSKRMEIQKNNKVCVNDEGYILGDIRDNKDKILDIVKKHGKQITIVIATPPCQGKLMLHHVGEIEEPIIERTYTFFGFNGLDQCQYPDKVPKDLAPFIREPFDNWYYTNKMPPYKGHGGSDFDYFMSASFDIDNLSNEDSKLRIKGNPNSFININHTIKMDYEGPKYLLEKDEDLYVNEVKCPLQEETMFTKKTKTYYLHFNPKQQYITLYTDKMNTKEN